MASQTSNSLFMKLFGQGSVYETIDSDEVHDNPVPDHPYYHGYQDDEGGGIARNLAESGNGGDDPDSNRKANPGLNQRTDINGISSNHYYNNDSNDAGADDDEDNEVPQSLLVETPLINAKSSSLKQPPQQTSPINMPGHFKNRSVIIEEPSKQMFQNALSNHKVRGFLNSHQRPDIRPSTGFLPKSPNLQKKQPGRESKINSNQFNAAGPMASKSGSNLQLIDPKERAAWKWANVENLDNFLQDVYEYFLGNGLYCILLSRALNMATLLFVVGFSTYLGSCIDYSKIRTSQKLSEIHVPHCMAEMSFSLTFLLWLFALFWFMKLLQYVHDFRRLVELRNFYFYLLDISESDMQTISWQQVVKRLMLLRDQNPVTSSTVHHRHKLMGTQSKQRMDPHDIANRIMRKDNYFIALINKDILQLTLPLPLIGKQNFFTRTLEWNISLCILDFVFNEQGQVRPVFLKESHRNILANGLRRRFLFAGFMNIICAPFTVVYLTVLYFFRYFNEFHKDPGLIGTRQYTPLAEWRMRELNELYHLFRRRLNMSYLPASRYVNQFPKEKTVLLLRFVVFVAGSFAAVLGIVSLVDPELFLGFEISKDKTVLFYIGIFGTILAVSRSMIPEETLVFDPESSLRYVAEFTHYLPVEWEGKLHSDEVKNEFSKMYALKVMIILRELASVIITPFILWFSLPKSSEAIVDFFREFSVHVDGLGYVCSFAMFDFEKHNRTRSKDGGLRDEYFSSSDGKMLKSYLNFLDSYGTNAGNVPLVPPYQKRGNNMSGSHYPGAVNRRPDVNDGGAADMENSVMGRFNKLHHGGAASMLHSGLVDSSGTHHGGMTTAYEVHHPGLRSAVASFVSDSIYQGDDSQVGKSLDNSFENPLRASDDEDLDEDENSSSYHEDVEGGVLGLLSKFYKQSDATYAQKI